jgi:hypothetical protein
VRGLTVNLLSTSHRRLSFLHYFLGIDPFPSGSGWIL